MAYCLLILSKWFNEQRAENFHYPLKISAAIQTICQLQFYLRIVYFPSRLYAMIEARNIGHG